MFRMLVCLQYGMRDISVCYQQYGAFVPVQIFLRYDIRVVVMEASVDARDTLYVRSYGAYVVGDYDYGH